MALELGRDVARPDLILGPDQETLADDTGLNPCPACNAYQADSPEGIHDVHTARKHPGAKAGDPKWSYPHCWKCGYRPGTNQVSSAAQLAREFAAFQSWREDQLKQLSDNQPSLNAELAAQNEDYQKQIADLKSQLNQGK